MRRLCVWGAIVLAGIVLVSGAACDTTDPSSSATPTPRSVTAEEAQLLATTRFRNFDAGSRAISTSVPIDGQTVRIDGWVDYTTHTGYATASGSGFAPQLLRWNLGTVAFQPAASRTSPGTQRADPMLPMPTHGWQTRQMDPTRSDLDLVLLVISRLGADRPENPLLLQQSGALWLGEQDLRGTQLSVFASPPTDKPLASAAPNDPDASGLRLWVDAGGVMQRAQVRATAGWVDVDFGDAGGTRLRALPTPSRAGP